MTPSVWFDLNYVKRTGNNGVPNFNKCDELKGGEGHKYKCVNLEKLYYKVFHEARREDC